MKMEKIAYIHYGQGSEPRLTISAEVKEQPLQWQRRGLQYTASGYGRKIPTSYMVKVNDRWRRVYCCIFSNSGTLYIGSGKKWEAIVDI